MRTAFAAAILLGAAALVPAQPPKAGPKEPPKEAPKEPPKEAPKAAPKDEDYVPPAVPQPRYGVKPRVKQYPQDTPKAALRSALAAVADGDYPYLVAHLMDAKFVEAAVNDRVKQFEAPVTLELAQLRDFQRAYPERVTPEERLPLDPRGFAAVVARKARERAFKQLLRDIEAKLTDDPQTVKDLRRIYRDGMFADSDPVATATHPDVKYRTLYFKKVGDRWFLENRQADEPKKDEPKKEP